MQTCRKSGEIYENMDVRICDNHGFRDIVEDIVVLWEYALRVGLLGSKVWREQHCAQSTRDIYVHAQLPLTIIIAEA